MFVLYGLQNDWADFDDIFRQKSDSLSSTVNSGSDRCGGLLWRDNKNSLSLALIKFTVTLGIKCIEQLCMYSK